MPLSKKFITYAIIALTGMLSVSSAHACTLVSLPEAIMRSDSHMVVWGKHIEDGTSGKGTITIKRTEKGPILKSVKVYWSSGSDENLSASCPSLSGMMNGKRARFFLYRDSDGAYLVLGYDRLGKRIEK